MRRLSISSQCNCSLGTMALSKAEQTGSNTHLFATRLRFRALAQRFGQRARRDLPAGRDRGVAPPRRGSALQQPGHLRARLHADARRHLLPVGLGHEAVVTAVGCGLGGAASVRGEAHEHEDSEGEG